MNRREASQTFDAILCDVENDAALEALDAVAFFIYSTGKEEARDLLFSQACFVGFSRKKRDAFYAKMHESFPAFWKDLDKIRRLAVLEAARQFKRDVFRSVESEMDSAGYETVEDKED